ncbi:hypothetical protein BDY24DRAFT_399147 [Mrakia frigida]|uniref:uncharacterized protein n=1 Tax=Mrakia frigida TaxID=29902 RepID=UPI003FCC0B1C
MPSATSLEDEALDVASGLELDAQTFFIALVLISVGGLTVRYVWRKFINPPAHSGYGWGSPGFITSGVRKAWVPNPNPGRQIIERDDRHLYQDGVSAPDDAAPVEPTHTSFSIKEKLAQEKLEGGKKNKPEGWEDEWLPEGAAKLKNAGNLKERKGKGKK